jgi:plasmid stabilization system protein ParE
MFTVKYVPKAIEDLRAIAAYIAQDNPDRALSFISEIEERTDRILSLAPKSGTVYKGETRFFPVGGYVVLYEIDENRKTVTVLHVVNGRMDWKK